MNRSYFYISMLMLLFTLTVYNCIMVTNVVNMNNGLVTVYTPENIYFLEGNILKDEKGELGQQGFVFESRQLALQALEDITANDANDAYEVLASYRN